MGLYEWNAEINGLNRNVYCNIVSDHEHYIYL